MIRISKSICISLAISLLIIPITSYGSIINNDNTYSNNQYNEFILSDKSVTIYLKNDRISYGQELLWKANTTGTNYEESAVVYVDGIAYISSCSTHGKGHDSLFAVNTSNGNILWSKLIGPGYVGPVIDNDVIYIGTSSHGYDPANEYVYAINRHDGTELWNRNIYGGIPESIQFDNEKIYFTSNLIYALNKTDGSIIWTYQLDSFSVTKPLLKDNAFYTATSGGRMCKVDVNDGSRIWEVSLSSFSWDNSITSDSKGNIFLALYGDRTINSYDENDGSLIWSKRLHGNSLSFNAYHDDVLFISCDRGYVYAFNSLTGSLIWENKIGDKIDISSPTISGGLLFIGTRDFEESAFFALDEKSGEILWKYNIENSVTAPPSIADGMMLCGSDNWYMYAFNFGIGSDNWTLHRYDKYNTAYSPNGLNLWQHVEANCSTNMNNTNCTITNFYDHEVTNITLILEGDSIGNWFDSNGVLLKTNSNNYTINNLSSLNSINLIISRSINSPPNKPIINGPISGKIGNKYNYTLVSVDNDDDNISYYVDWGDKINSGWTRFLPSGQEYNISHIWKKEGSYEIKVKAKDEYGNEGEWSDPLIVSMPKNKSYDEFNNLILNLLKRSSILEFLLYKILSLS
jgi:outer membrane protein assembly factor BamB